MRHDLKCWPEYFAAVLDGSKTFEVRYNDRNFQPGDTVTLKEFHPCSHCKGVGITLHVNFSSMDKKCPACKGSKGLYLGNMKTFNVGYVLKDIPELKPGFCCFSLLPL